MLLSNGSDWKESGAWKRAGVGVGLFYICCRRGQFIDGVGSFNYIFFRKGDGG